jgi:hypothetical protein
MKPTLRTLALLAIAVFQHQCSHIAELRAQPAAKPISGTVTEFKPAALEIGVQADSGEIVFVKVGPQTEVVQVPPGKRDLSAAKPAMLTSLSRGDRVLVSFVTGLAEARRIVWITATDIATRNQAERLDWQTRGISGIVTGIRLDGENGGRIALEIRTPEGAHTATVTVTGKTKIRRYAPDSVKFADAVASSTAEIAVGDQLQARGPHIQTGTEGGAEAHTATAPNVTAEDVVFGTFLTRLGSITAVNREANEIQIQELTTRQPLIIRIAADSRLKKMPDMRAILTGKPVEGDPTAKPGAERFDLQRALERLPMAAFEDLKPGGGVIVTSTRGSRDGEVTAIMILANADFLVRMAQGQAEGEHGGVLVGAGGISLPTMIP